MAPLNKLKTYVNKNTSRTHSENVINDLFAKNIKQRLLRSSKKSKILLAELPPRRNCYIKNDSINVSTEDAFDKVKNGGVFNKVNLVNSFKKVNSSESDISKSNLLKSITINYSPKIKRRTRKNLRKRMPVNESQSICPRLNEETREEDRINLSLEIERADFKNIPVNQSQLICPRLNEEISLEIERDDFKKNGSLFMQSYSNIDNSLSTLFSNTFNGKQNIYSSTPVVHRKLRHTALNKDFTLENKNTLLEKSYEEIRQWEIKVPEIDSFVGSKSKILLQSPNVVVVEDFDNTFKSFLINEISKRKLNESSSHFDYVSLTNNSKSRIKSKKSRNKKTNHGISKSYRNSKNNVFKTLTVRLERLNIPSKTNISILSVSLDLWDAFESKNQLYLNEVDASDGQDSNDVNLLKKCDNELIVKLNDLKNDCGISQSAPSVNSRKSISNHLQNKTPLNVTKRNRKTIRSTRYKFSRRNIDQENYMVKDVAVILEKLPNTCKYNGNKYIEMPNEFEAINNSEKKHECIKEPVVNLTLNNYNHLICITNRNSNEYKQISYPIIDLTLNNYDHLLCNVEKFSTNNISNSNSQHALEKEESGLNVELHSTEKSFYSISSSDEKEESKYKINIISSNESILPMNYVCDYSNLSGITINTTKNNSSIKYKNEDVSKADVSESIYKQSFISFASNDFNSTNVSNMHSPILTRNRRKNRPLENKSNSNIHEQHSSSSTRRTKSRRKKQPVKNTSNVDIHLISSESFNLDSTNKSDTSTGTNQSILSEKNIIDNINLPILTRTRRKNQPLENATISKQSLICSESNYLGSNEDVPKESKILDGNPPEPSICTEVAKENQLSTLLNNLNNTKHTSPVLNNIDNSKLKDSDGFAIPSFKHPKNSCVFKSGKLWRRSFSNYKKNSLILNASLAAKESPCNSDKCQTSILSQTTSQKRCSVKVIPISLNNPRRKSILEIYASTSYVSVQDIVDSHLENSVRSLSISKRNSQVKKSLSVTARDVVLRRCGQTEPLPFEKCYSKSILQNCQKIGEGVYGEVFLYQNLNGGTSVMKVIPIEGDLLINGERQKKFEEIISEIIIAMELSNLRNNKKNTTTGFSEVQKIKCVKGRYPERLLDLWDLYEETKGSENDSPEMFDKDQLYIVLELANGGKDLESYVFNNAMQAFSMFKQVAISLAIAESELQFEHRDLHWGNILLSTVDKRQKQTFCLDGKLIEVDTHGVEVAIIDFTLSRIEYDGVVIFNDLSLDPELFTAQGDYQFEIYRQMQKKNEDKWYNFEPFTNILWLHYTLDKAVTALRYKYKQTKLHKEYLNKLRLMKEDILNYNSVKEFVLNYFDL